MPVVDNQVTSPGERGLQADAMNQMGHWLGFPAVSATANVFSLPLTLVTGTTSSAQTTTSGAGSTISTQNFFTTWQTSRSASTSVGTQVDYCRNLNYSFSASASSALFSAGTIYVAGKDLFRVARTESKPVSSVISSGTFYNGTLNFGEVTGLTMNAGFVSSLLTASINQLSDSNGGTTRTTAGQTAAPAFTLRVGMGPKLGVLPIDFKKIDAVVYASQQGAAKTTTTSTGSTNNQFSVFTGNYAVGGVSFTSALDATQRVELSYKLNGFQI